MSTDAFAAAVVKGAALHRPHWREAVRAGLIFGCIEATTPIVGWGLGSLAESYVEAWDHWIAFGLLGALGAKMIWEGLQTADEPIEERPTRHPFWMLALTGFATSIDAMAIGVGLAFLDVPILPVAAAIGLTTFLLVTVGVLLGRVHRRGHRQAGRDSRRRLPDRHRRGDPGRASRPGLTAAPTLAIDDELDDERFPAGRAQGRPDRPRRHGLRHGQLAAPRRRRTARLRRPRRRRPGLRCPGRDRLRARRPSSPPPPRS